MSAAGIIFVIWAVYFVMGAFFIRPSSRSSRYDDTRVAVAQAILDADRFGHKQK